MHHDWLVKKSFCQFFNQAGGKFETLFHECVALETTLHAWLPCTILDTVFFFLRLIDLIANNFLCEVFWSINDTSIRY